MNGLVSASDLIELKREFFRLDGASGQLRANVAEAMTKISGIEIQILRLSQNRQEEAISRLRDLKYSEIELEERRNGLLQRYERLALRSPVDGVVFGKRTFNKKSVVRAAEPIMYIVPDWAPLQISVRVEPIDIDQVFPGQPANLRFTSFDQRLTPEVSGTVIRVSAGTVSDDVSGTNYFEAVILPHDAALAELSELQLIPGMPVEAFLRTGDRTPLSFLVRPISDYFHRALREG